MLLTIPSPSMTCFASRRMRSVSVAEDPKGTRSSSWKLKPQAPNLASWRMLWIGSSGGRTSRPNTSRPANAVHHRPTVNLFSLRGSYDMDCPVSPPLSWFVLYCSFDDDPRRDDLALAILGNVAGQGDGLGRREVG